MSEESSFVSTVAAIPLRDATLVLPAELLTDVFKYLTTIYPKYKPKSTQTLSYRRHHTRLSWLVVSHVNQRWRYIVLDTPSLWSRLYVDMEKSWDAFLECSKPALLSIEGPCSTSHIILRIPSLIEHRHRIRELDLQRITPYHLGNLVAGLTDSLLNIEVMSIECEPFGDEPVLELPADFFSVTMPNLRKLKLIDVEFPWGTGSMSLTNFEYRAIPSHY
ncbi:hypothetical protein PENSPDRAFT_758220 [Peniophora sp. CONT]|nr:hypothetical protein PENSPDRAFT_758220 [Peniophora sp. CONT]